VKEPKLLLADEPTGDLDPVTGSAVIDLMLGAAQKATVVIVTHSPSVAEKLDRVITLDAGVLVKDGRSVS
jgi:putative ABC transport system ATP-binding protein